jgi:hypothetical protein
MPSVSARISTISPAGMPAGAALKDSGKEEV